MGLGITTSLAFSLLLIIVRQWSLSSHPFVSKHKCPSLLYLFPFQTFSLSTLDYIKKKSYKFPWLNKTYLIWNVVNTKAHNTRALTSDTMKANPEIFQNNLSFSYYITSSSSIFRNLSGWRNIHICRDQENILPKDKSFSGRFTLKA